MRLSLILAVGLIALPGISAADCCELVKLDPEPAATRVRVCDSADGADCEQPRFEGELSFAAPVAICATANEVKYREFDPASGAYGAAVTARCDASTRVEL